MIKAMHVLAGNGPQLNTTLALDQLYTHPHFGQLFLAATLATIGYPNILSPEPNLQSIESLNAVPRFIMGLLAVLDTFIIFHIAKRQFDGTVALVASSLFAVLPATLVLRLVLLDNILLPFLLSSILFSLYLKPGLVSQGQMWRNHLLILLSGILLGIAIYTKIPAFTMIPLVGYLIFRNSKRLKNVVVWLVPVILIPCLWPAYALSAGQFDLWIDGITVQATRQGSEGELLSAFWSISKTDPLFLVLGTAGLVYAAVRKVYWMLLWVIPLLIFSYFIEWVIHFHLVPLFPAFCISGAFLIVRIFKFELWRRLIFPVFVSAIICFGFVVSILLITLNVNSHQFEVQAVVAEKLMNDNNINFIGHRVYYWIPKYVFQASFDTFPRDSVPVNWNESEIIYVDNGKCCEELRDATKKILSFKKPSLPEHYPYTGVKFNPSIGKEVAVRVN